MRILTSKTNLWHPHRLQSLHSFSKSEIPTIDPLLLKRNGGYFTFLSALAITISYADRSNLSTAIIPMAEAFHWDSLFSGLVLSSFWAGYAVTQVIGGRLADKIGGEKILLVALLGWSFCTGFTPAAASLGNTPLLLIRVLLGAFEGMAFPAIHSMIQKYVSKSGESTSTAVITAACYLGALLSNLAAPALIAQGGFQAVFELFALLPPLLWVPLWWKFIQQQQSSPTSSTEADPLVIENSIASPVEAVVAKQEDISDVTKADAEVGEVFTIRELLQFPSVWAIIAAQYGQSWGMIGLLSWLPTYFSERFHVPLTELSSFTVLPYFLQMAVAVSAGTVADFLIGRSDVRPILVRKLFQTVGMLGPALCLYLCATLPDLSVSTASELVDIGSALSALTVAAVSVSHFDISPRNAGTIFGLGNTASCIGGLIAVPLSGYIFETTHSWSAVFLLFVAHYLLGAVAWVALASDSPLRRERFVSQ